MIRSRSRCSRCSRSKSPGRSRSPSPFLNQDGISREDCEKWLKNKLVNPITGKKISSSAKNGIYSRFEKACKEMKEGKNVDKPLFKGIYPWIVEQNRNRTAPKLQVETGKINILPPTAFSSKSTNKGVTLEVPNGTYELVVKTNVGDEGLNLYWWTRESTKVPPFEDCMYLFDIINERLKDDDTPESERMALLLNQLSPSWNPNKKKLIYRWDFPITFYATTDIDVLNLELKNRWESGGFVCWDMVVKKKVVGKAIFEKVDFINDDFCSFGKNENLYAFGKVGEIDYEAEVPYYSRWLTGIRRRSADTLDNKGFFLLFSKGKEEPSEEEIMRYINAGVDVNYSEKQETVLSQAVCRGFVNSVRILIRNGADPRGDLVETAARFGDPEMTELLLEKGASVSGLLNEVAKFWHNKADPDKKIKTINLIAKWGGDPNEQIGGTSPLMEALNDRRPDPVTIQALVDIGADPNRPEVVERFFEVVTNAPGPRPLRMCKMPSTPLEEARRGLRGVRKSDSKNFKVVLSILEEAALPRFNNRRRFTTEWMEYCNTRGDAKLSELRKLAKKETKPGPLKRAFEFSGSIKELRSEIDFMTKRRLCAGLAKYFDEVPSVFTPKLRGGVITREEAASIIQKRWRIARLKPEIFAKSKAGLEARARLEEYPSAGLNYDAIRNQPWYKKLHNLK
jgi:hypothetical protein